MTIKAMLFAAGFGTRLRPLTLTQPKPLLPVGGRPLLDWVLGHLARFGVEEAVLNAHHLAEQIQAYAAQYPAMRLQVLVETPQILGTGGGLWNARQALAGASLILVCNGDILTDLDLA